VRHWITILERVYGVFRIPPFGPARIKAVKKEQKLYFWDWSRIEDLGARLENLVAVHLLRLCHYLEDVLGESVELRYFRDVVGHEVDFILLLRKKPWIAVEVKSGDRRLGGGLKYLLERSHFTFACQVGARGGQEKILPPINGCPIHLMPLTRLLAAIP
jgi:predicted AAA+ superfamily ATPase